MVNTPSLHREHLQLEVLDGLVISCLDVWQKKAGAADSAASLRQFVMEGHIQQAMSMLKGMCPQALQDLRLVFRLQRQQFIELVRNARHSHEEDLRALACARDQLAPLALDAYPEAYCDFKKLLTLLLYAKTPDPDQPADVREALDTGARQELAQIVDHTVRQHTGQQEPLLALLLTYLLRLYSMHMANSRASAAAQLGSEEQEHEKLVDALLGMGRDAAPLPPESGLGPSSFSEHDINALVHCAGCTRRDAVAALKRSNNDLLAAFKAELARLRLNKPLLHELLHEYIVYRGLRVDSHFPLEPLAPSPHPDAGSVQHTDNQGHNSGDNGASAMEVDGDEGRERLGRNLSRGAPGRGAQPQQQQQQQQQGVSRPPIHSASQPASSAPGTEAGAYAPMFGSVVLDDSEEFMRWRAEVDISLRGLASATNALAACSSSSSTASSTASGPAVSAKEAIAQLQQHCGALVELADHLRKQPAASKWLNSSSACIDTTGAFLTIREAIAEHVYRLMDVQNTELLMKACSVVLRVVKSRGPLLQAGKLLYRLSKDSNNDATFRRERLLEPIVRIIQIMVTTAASSTSTSGANLFEPLVYFCGTLKNVTNEPGNQRALVKAGSLHVLSTALSITVAQFQAAGGPSSTSADPSAPPQSHSQLQSNSSTGDRGIGGPLGPSASLLPCNAPSSGPGQVAVQVTGALRNLAVAPAHAPAFLAATCLAALKAALRVLGGQQEVVLNIGRVLSKLSLHEQCQEALEADTEFAPLLLDLLHRYQHHRALLLRIAFALGNLTTLSGAYRKQVASVPGGLDLMISVLHLYASGAESTDQPQETSGPGSARGGEGAGPDAAAAAATAPVLNTKADRLSRAASREDCLVKLLRLIANSAIDTEVGPKLASSPSLCHSLLTLLQHHRYTCGSEEELVLNAVCTLTNVSFYQSHDNKVLALEPTTLLVHITPLLLSDNEEAIVEAARLFGNFSRAPHARAYMADTRVLEALVLLLDHSSTEVLYSVCGTLINFSADVQQWSELMRLGTPSHLLEALERVMGAECGKELEVATLCVVCKALFNLCSEGMQECGAHPSSPALSQEECSTLVEVLQAVHGCDRLMALPEVPEVTSRLLAQAEQSLGLKS